VTHAHSDHHGLAGDVCRASGASVYAHPQSCPMLEEYTTQRAQRQAFYSVPTRSLSRPFRARPGGGARWWITWPHWSAPRLWTSPSPGPATARSSTITAR
jgi:glyoxylase-like metal-dependent hydrolase (beta-lactamase superfamily II)